MSRGGARPVAAGLAAVVGFLMLIQAFPLGHMINHVSTASGAELTTLKVGMLQGVDSLNPFVAYEDSSYVIFNLIYDRLITYDQDLKPTPLIAKSWEVDRWAAADNASTPNIDEGADRLWRYHIVEGATWHDGEPLTAEDVAYSINVNLDVAMWAFTPYVNNRMADHATAIDANTVEVYLKIPNVHVETLVLPIVPKHIWSLYTPGEIQYTVANDHPIGSGPFKFVEFVRDQHVILERNPDYHLGPVAYDRLVFLFYGSDQVMAEDLKNGNIDVARFPPLTFESLKGQPNVETGVARRYWQSTLGFNCFTDPSSQGNPLLLDVNIRQAMHLALNKSYIIDTVWGGYGDVGYALPAPVVPYYHWEPTAAESLNYNVSRANALLDSAGYDKKDSNGVRMVNRSNNSHAPLDTKLSFKFQVRNDNPEDMAAAPYVKEMWKAIGVDVQIEPTDESALETDVYVLTSHQVYMWYWSGDYDPTYILGVMTTDQIWGWNDPFWSNETYDNLYLVQMTQTGAQRQQTVFEMQRIFYESSGLIVIAYPYALFAWSTLHFTGWADPAEHPGMTIDQFFGANPLFMALKPIGGKGGGISSTVLIGAGAAVALVVVVGGALMLRRRKGEKLSEKEMKEEKKTGLE